MLISTKAGPNAQRYLAKDYTLLLFPALLRSRRTLAEIDRPRDRNDPVRLDLNVRQALHPKDVQDARPGIVGERRRTAGRVHGNCTG
ncbi:hypothetical protein [Jiella sp. M17.18]|uniref:hypothetical protein n=1 Tax=Jiella sp. M17.18 TaxID=3234247 RepID=UPI0034DF1D5A